MIGAIGVTPTPELGLFAYGRGENGHATVVDADEGLLNSPLDFDERRLDLGAHYRFSPQSTLWLKAGRGNDTLTLQGMFDGGNINLLEEQNSHDIQVRHTVALGAPHELTWGFEAGSRDRSNRLQLDVTDEPGALVVDQAIEDRSVLLYGSDRLAIGTRLLIQGDVVVQRYRKSVRTLISASDDTGVELGESVEDVTSTHVSPRAGVVYRFGDQQLFRCAYQRFVRPISVSTLGPVATAGIPLSDRFTQPGGTSSRIHAQVEWAWMPTTFTTGGSSREVVTNLSLADGVEQAPSELGLQKIRNQILVNPAAVDLLEDTPEFGRGTINWGGVTLSQLLGEQFSAYSRYAFASSGNTAAELRGHALPLVPRHLFLAGVTWVSPRRFYVTGQGVYRSSRFVDESHELAPLDAGWHATIKAYWELPSKRWSIEANADELLSKRDPVAFWIDVKFRY